MKREKKQLAATLVESLQDKLKNAETDSKKLAKAIKKTAKKLAEKIIKVSVRQQKKLEKQKGEPTSKLGPESTESDSPEIETRLKAVTETERETLSGNDKPTN
ncbi:hypothetical protein MUK70_04565 [Dyadobacter chenwenxiniae]|uniref:Uncharacterized protein n=1 Tax=Dyadobacter chenwenxiniae TaxID=2906456 RepID=A0A9X1PNY9_9BACT|nr:hypothetical protein [Dyadobacter chenwenxiniae]MCF0064680.1 hypothetical protein [Dyadobacter chenwenxiniae]UON84266.1 hypothetical protein MUK70_04565 [Dyadobacter chenwenxiniae]